MRMEGFPRERYNLSKLSVGNVHGGQRHYFYAIMSLLEPAGRQSVACEHRRLLEVRLDHCLDKEDLAG